VTKNRARVKAIASGRSRQTPQNGQGEKATIKDVAETAGLSLATVSYVVNGTRNVLPETRRRGLSAVREVGYVPNASALSLATGGSRMLGVIVSSIRNPFFPEIITAFQDAAILCDMDSIVMDTNYDAQRLRNTVDRLLGLQVQGVAVVTSQIDPSVIATLRVHGVGAVYLDLGAVSPYVSNISVDYEHGIASALEHVRDLGHTRIGFIGGRPDGAGSPGRDCEILPALQSGTTAPEPRLPDAGRALPGEGMRTGTSAIGNEASARIPFRLCPRRQPRRDPSLRPARP
jgi:DNA-binding LacI/PurR family transcriptional regulator